MFQLQARDVTTMRSYAQAKHAFDTLPKYNEFAAYLSRNKELRIVKRGENYQCTYNGNVCVTYMPDDTVELRSAGWITPSTSVFISRCTGIRTYTWKRTKMYAYLGDGHYVLPVKVDLTTMRPVNPTQEQRKVVDKKRAAELRKPFKAFFHEVESLAAAMPYSKNGVDAFADELPYSMRDTSHYAVRDMAARLQDGETELVKRWLFHVAHQPYKARGYNRPAHDPNILQRVRRAKGLLMQSIYAANDAWVWEDVPLGQIGKEDMY